MALMFMLLTPKKVNKIIANHVIIINLSPGDTTSRTGSEVVTG
jgi:hypothetical protein